MSVYVPDKWVVLRIAYKDKVVDKVLAGWQGGYLGGDAWQLNSGIVKVVEHNDRFEFHGYSGSLYVCYMPLYGFSGLMHSVFNRWQEAGLKMEILKEYDVRSKH